MKKPYTLYGVACSLYAAKARSYLCKQSIDFIELPPTHPDYLARIQPAIGRMIVPVLETPEGDIIQDGSDIIDYFERKNLAKTSAYPESAVLQAVSFLFELFGGEGLLRPAMHYRWSFDEENLDFLKSEFVPFAGVDADDELVDQVFAFASGSMRKAAVAFGVSEDSKPIIEASFREFLTLFTDHLQQHGYLLGGQASLGDYAMMGPLYGHLYRDPAPSLLMRQRAPRVARWVERTNREQEYWADNHEASSFVNPQQIPETLKALMRFVAEEYLPEIITHVDYANNWLADRPQLQQGSNGLDNPAGRMIGFCKFDWRGIQLSTMVMPYRFYLLQRLQDCYDQADDDDRKAIEQLFSETGLSALLQARTTRRVVRQNHLEVWGAVRA